MIGIKKLVSEFSAKEKAFVVYGVLAVLFCCLSAFLIKSLYGGNCNGPSADWVCGSLFVCFVVTMIAATPFVFVTIFAIGIALSAAMEFVFLLPYRVILLLLEEKGDSRK